MQKTLLVAIHRKWLFKILHEDKEFEFRNWKVPEGTVLYFYESKGPRKGMLNETPVNEGRGLVMARARVKKVYDLHDNKDSYDWITRNESNPPSWITPEMAEGWGYTNQKYAIELEDIEIAARHISIHEFLKSGTNDPVKKAPQSRVYVWTKKVNSNDFVKRLKWSTLQKCTT